VLSKSSFEAELIAFRDSLKPPQPDEQGRLVGNRNAADLALIERWLARSDREELWAPLRRYIGAPALIRLVLTARRKAQATANQLYGVTWKGPSFDKARRILNASHAGSRATPIPAYILRMLKRELRRLKRDEPALAKALAKALEKPEENAVQIAADLEIIGLRREWGEIYKKLRYPTRATPGLLDHARRLLSLYSSSAALDERPRERENRDSCRQRLFWTDVSEHLKIQSGGKPFDREVAAFTEIAFNLEKGSVDIKHVTEARKRRRRAEQP
jgi:hypothetical protein